MIKRKKVIRTSNKEVYEKFNLLNFSSSVLLEDVKKQDLAKLLKNINKNGTILELSTVGDYFVVRKKAPLNFVIYLNKTNSKFF